ncbi:MAG: TonB-dependent receptor, partial [Deltaproteobacteria bacterium]|nr:TonB-dependent receptor [Deltaproteobacteria bacterium]
LGVSSVAEALDRLPGISRSNDSPWSADLVIRGMTRDSVVVLIDGMRVNMTTDINGRFALVPASQIERIEVLKGPISALYGAGSIGGVVNIITKSGTFTDAPQWHGETFLSGGSNPVGGDLAGDLLYSSDSVWIRGALSGRHFNDYHDGHGDRVDNSQFRDVFGDISAGLRWNEPNRTLVKLWATEADEVGIPGSGTAPLPVGADVTLARHSAKRAQLVHSFAPSDSVLEDSTLNLGYQIIERRPRIDNFPAGQVLRIEPAGDHETLAMDWRNRFGLNDHTLTLGLETWNWHMATDRTRTLKNGKVLKDKPSPNTDQLSVGVYAEDDWVLNPDWIINIGGRLDRISIVNERTETVESGSRHDMSWAGNLGLTYRLTDRCSLTGLIASSYRIPTISELFKNINLGGGVTEEGNPDLDPERSIFAELGTHYADSDLSVDLSAYANFVDDLIVSSPVDPTLYRMENVSKAEIYGAEAAAQWAFASLWDLFGTLAYTRGRDVQQGEPLRFIPPLNGLVGIKHHPTENFWWTLESAWNAAQHEVPNGVDSSAFYAVVNARCGLEFEASGLMHELGLAINNLLDRQYYNYLATSRGVELAEPGINAVATWQIRF